MTVKNSHSPLECFSVLALERFEADRALFEEKGLAPAENSIHVEKMYPGEHEWNVWRMCLRDFAQYLFHE